MKALLKYTRRAAIAVAGAGMLAAASVSAETVIRIQSVIPSKADEVKMLQEFANDVEALTNGSVKFKILPAGAVVGVKETLDAVDAGLIGLCQRSLAQHGNDL